MDPQCRVRPRRCAGRVAALLAAAWLAGPTAALAAPMLEITLDDATVGLGDHFTASLTMAGIDPAGAGLFGFGTIVVFEAAALSAADPVLDPIWTGSVDTENTPGRVGATANTLSMPTGDVPLFSVEFTAIAEGDYLLSLTPFTGPGDNLLADGTVLDQDPQALFGEPARVSVGPPGSGGSAIPEPTGAALFALGLALVARGRRSLLTAR